MDYRSSTGIVNPPGVNTGQVGRPANPPSSPYMLQPAGDELANALRQQAPMYGPQQSGPQMRPQMQPQMAAPRGGMSSQPMGQLPMSLQRQLIFRR